MDAPHIFWYKFFYCIYYIWFSFLCKYIIKTILILYLWYNIFLLLACHYLLYNNFSKCFKCHFYTIVYYKQKIRVFYIRRFCWSIKTKFSVTKNGWILLSLQSSCKLLKRNIILTDFIFTIIFLLCVMTLSRKYVCIKCLSRTEYTSLKYEKSINSDLMAFRSSLPSINLFFREKLQNFFKLWHLKGMVLDLEEG